MHRTLGISPKLLLPLLGHLAVAIALFVSGHQDLAWQYAATALPVHTLLSYLAPLGAVVPIDLAPAVADDTGEEFATEPFTAPTTDDAPATDPAGPVPLSDEQVALIAKQVATALTTAAH